MAILVRTIASELGNYNAVHISGGEESTSVELIFAREFDGTITAIIGDPGTGAYSQPITVDPGEVSAALGLLTTKNPVTVAS